MKLKYMMMAIAVAGAPVAVHAEKASVEAPVEKAMMKKVKTVAFSEDKLAALRSAGEKVFVEVSAEWCGTCQENKASTMNTDVVNDAFAAQDITLMFGDWTDKNETVGAYLKAHNRKGPPLYVYYEGEKEGVVLPRKVTPEIVLESIGAQAE